MFQNLSPRSFLEKNLSWLVATILSFSTFIKQKVKIAGTLWMFSWTPVHIIYSSLCRRLIFVICLFKNKQQKNSRNFLFLSFCFFCLDFFIYFLFETRNVQFFVLFFSQSNWTQKQRKNKSHASVFIQIKGNYGTQKLRVRICCRHWHA